MILANLFRAEFVALLAVQASCVALMLVASRQVGAALGQARSLELEKREEFTATLVATACGMGVIGVFVQLYGAARAHHSLEGAMCAYGVFSATPFGFLALAFSIGSSLLALIWLELHWLELELRDPKFTTMKLKAALGLVPLFVLSLVFSGMHVVSLDFGVSSTCCSSGGSALRDLVRGASFAPQNWAFLAFVGLGIATSALLARRAMPKLTMAISIMTLFVAGPAIVGFVAPHAFENPLHFCAFCLFEREGMFLGYPLSLLLLSAGAAGIAQGLASLAPELDAPRELLSRRAAWAWTLVVVLAAFPAVRFWVVSGGASLFG